MDESTQPKEQSGKRPWWDWRGDRRELLKKAAQDLGLVAGAVAGAGLIAKGLERCSQSRAMDRRTVSRWFDELEQEIAHATSVAELSLVLEKLYDLDRAFPDYKHRINFEDAKRRLIYEAKVKAAPITGGGGIFMSAVTDPDIRGPYEGRLDTIYRLATPERLARLVLTVDHFPDPLAREAAEWALFQIHQRISRPWQGLFPQLPYRQPFTVDEWYDALLALDPDLPGRIYTEWRANVTAGHNYDLAGAQEELVHAFHAAKQRRQTQP